MEMPDDFSGAVLVTRGGETVLRTSDGMSRSDGTPCTPETRFQIASVSKQFTAAAAMLLVEEGETDLDGPISHRLPDTPEAWRQLTLHQLLTHTAGLGHWPEIPGFDVDDPGDARQALERLSTVPLLSTPGSTWRYSSPGYLLVAQLVERVSGQRYADFLAERVLKPLGMTSTSAGDVPPGPAAHGFREGSRVDAAAFAAMPGTGDIWSTVDDLARYAAAFDAGDLLTARSRAALVAPHVSVAGLLGLDGPAVADSYGYGHFRGTLAGHAARFHRGDNPGYQSFLARLPDLDATVAILCNNEESDLDALLRQILPAMLDT